MHVPAVVGVEEGEHQVETAALDVDAVVHHRRHVLVIGDVLPVTVRALQRDFLEQCGQLPLAQVGSLCGYRCGGFVSTDWCLIAKGRGK